MDSPTPSPPPLTAHLTAVPPAAGPSHHVNHQAIDLGREKVRWPPEVWKRIDEAVAHEAHRSSVAPKLLPHHRVPHHVTNIEADTVLVNLTPGAPPFSPPLRALAQGGTPPLLNVSETSTLNMMEISVELALSQAQVHKESEAKPSAQMVHHETHPSHDTMAHPGHHSKHPGHHEHPSTMMMLVRRATQTLCLARDAVIFLGSNAFPGAGGVTGIPLFTSQTVLSRGVPTDTGLTCIGGPNALPNTQVLAVTPSNTPAGGGANVLAQYSGNTVGQISAACSLLVSNGYSPPLVSVLYFYDYADSFAPLANTLVIPADRIKPVLDGGYYTSSVLPGIPTPMTGNNAVQLPGLPGLVNANTQAVGLVMSTAGNVVEFVNGLDPVTAFAFVDPAGNYVFRVFTRFATKISDPGAIVRLEFQ